VRKQGGLRSVGYFDPDDLGCEGLDRAVQVGLLGLLYLPDRFTEPVERFSLVRTLAEGSRELDTPGGKAAAVIGFENDCVLHNLFYFAGGYTAFLVGKWCRDPPGSMKRLF
jgi:hypothetical protein